MPWQLVVRIRDFPFHLGIPSLSLAVSSQVVSIWSFSSHQPFTNLPTSLPHLDSFLLFHLQVKKLLEYFLITSTLHPSQDLKILLLLKKQSPLRFEGRQVFQKNPASAKLRCAFWICDLNSSAEINCHTTIVSWYFLDSIQTIISWCFYHLSVPQISHISPSWFRDISIMHHQLLLIVPACHKFPDISGIPYHNFLVFLVMCFLHLHQFLLHIADMSNTSQHESKCQGLKALKI